MISRVLLWCLPSLVCGVLALGLSGLAAAFSPVTIQDDPYRWRSSRTLVVLAAIAAALCIFFLIAALGVFVVHALLSVHRD